MTMPWLFGEEVGTEDHGSFLKLQPRTFDIDVVPAVYRMLEASAAEQLRRWDDAHRELGMTDEMRQERLALELRSPQVTLHSFMYGMASEPEVIPVEKVADLGSYDRSRIRVQGAGIQVVFDRREYPTITTEVDADSRVTHQVAQLMRAEGRRRPQLGSVLAIAIMAFAVIVTALGIWALADAGARLPAVLLVGALLLTVCVVAWTISTWIARKSRTTSPYEGRRWIRFTGHAFREGSLSDVRAQIVKARATALVSLVTVPVGAVIGWFLSQWLG